MNEGLNQNILHLLHMEIKILQQTKHVMLKQRLFLIVNETKI